MQLLVCMSEGEAGCVAAEIRWGVDRYHGRFRHAYDTSTGLTLCTAAAFHPLDERELGEHEQFLPNCRACRVQAWEHTNPGLTYPSLH